MSGISKRLPAGPVVNAMQRAVESSDDSDLRFYMRRVLNDPTHAAKYVQHCQQLAQLCELRDGMRLLDVGCGFGWHAICIAALTGAEVVANDLRPLMTDAVAREVMRLRKAGTDVNVTPISGDICTLTSQLPPQSFDAVMSNQTIEHVHDLDAMFDACRQLLKPSGRLVITNDNNVYNASGLSAAKTLWTRRDTDWTYIRELQQMKPQEMQGIEPYAVTRERFIREANPALGDRAVESMVAATAGMLEPQIRSLAWSFSEATTLPVPPEWSWCRDPKTGEYVERQLDPFELQKTLTAAGFSDVRVRHAFRRWPLTLVNGIGIRPLNKLIFRRKASFILTACA